MEAMDIILIILAGVALVAVVAALAKKNKKPGPVPRPGAAVTAKPVATVKTTATPPKTKVSPAAKPTPVQTKPQSAPAKAPDPETVTLFAAVPVRNIRRCLSCDGENAPGTKLCCICGRKL